MPKSSAMEKQTTCWKSVELSFYCQEQFCCPEDIEFFAIFTSPSGKIVKVPGFWNGGREWKIRYTSNQTGIHLFETDSQPYVKGLAGRTGQCRFERKKNEQNPLYRHGFPVVKDRKILYSDGKEFFWLGDTWWMGLCKRLDRKGFKILAKDRREKGFTVIQIVAGLYPDMDWYDPRGKNEAGFPYSRDFKRLNPAYFKCADWKIKYLCDVGIVPCIVGAWGYYIKWSGIEKMKRHWRNIIARWSAYPVIWCIAGETIMPYYLSETRQADIEFQKKAWTEIAKYVKEIDPFGHPITTHPTNLGHEQLENPELLDINMLQTGHGSHTSFDNTWSSIKKAKDHCPSKPVVIGEVNYEGIGEACREEIQRICFWGSMLSGVSGYTYGANGIWQVNTEKKPYGPSPHGRSWGDTPWQVAYKLPGSHHVAVGKRILEKIGLYNLVPCSQKLELEGEKSCVFAAETGDGTIIIIYAGPPAFNSGIKKIAGLLPDHRYSLCFVDPKDGKTRKRFEIKTGSDGEWVFQTHYWRTVPVWQDWVLIIRRKT
ncbi:MAG: DUF4038 domain-containing protein [Candidatus Omnitrophica bacterium]|nr:DUF4038 domain-containing protein [Candidatus Omnitrophota bacterium]